MKNHLRLIFAVLFCHCCNLSAQEFCGIWVDAFGPGFLNKNEVSKLVSDCRKYNFNAVFVQMRRRGDAFYLPEKPNPDPRTTAIKNPRFDALAEIIKQCHTGEKRIEVHCWVTGYFIWSWKKPPPQKEHLFNKHPEYLTKDSLGQTIIGKGYFLDPGHPDANQAIHDMAMDIVKRYDIDGFHWDYLRYPNQNSGYNETAIKRYNAEFGLSGQPSPSDKQFSEWRRRQVTDFMRWVNADLLEINPKLVISVAVFSSLNDSFGYRFQDWSAWNREGLIDVTIPMDFSADNAGVFGPRLDDAFRSQGIRRVYPGQGAYLNTKVNTLEQLTQIRCKPFSGHVLYDYRHSNIGKLDLEGTFGYLKKNGQTEWVKTPVLPWKEKPEFGILKGTVINRVTKSPIYNAKVVMTGTATVTQLTEPHGKFVFFAAPTGLQKIEVILRDGQKVAQTIEVVPGKVSNMNFPVD